MSEPTITPAKLGELSRSGKKVRLIDVRTPAEFREVHVTFAENVPLDQLNPAALINGQSAALGEPIYFICKSGGRSQMACEQATKAGLKNVVNVEGGTLACVDAGLPVVRGRKTISLDNQVRILAGSIVLAGVGLGWWVHPAFFGLSAFIGAGFVFAGLTNTCGMGIMLSKMPWNQK